MKEVRHDVWKHDNQNQIKQNEMDKAHLVNDAEIEEWAQQTKAKVENLRKIREIN